MEVTHQANCGGVEKLLNFYVAITRASGFRASFFLLFPNYILVFGRVIVADLISIICLVSPVSHSAFLKQIVSQIDRNRLFKVTLYIIVRPNEWFHFKYGQRDSNGHNIK